MELIKQIAKDITYRGIKINGKGFAIGQISLDFQNNEAFIWEGNNRLQVQLNSLDKITPFTIGSSPIFEGDIIEFIIDFDDGPVVSREMVTYNRETGTWYGVQTDGLTSDPYLPGSFEGAVIIGRKKL